MSFCGLLIAILFVLMYNIVYLLYTMLYIFAARSLYLIICFTFILNKCDHILLHFCPHVWVMSHLKPSLLVQLPFIIFIYLKYCQAVC